MSKSFIGSTATGFDGSVSIAVVTAVAERRDVSSTELPPLYDWVDPDALDALFKSTRTGGSRRGRLEFTYAGHEIAVECADGEVAITIDGTPAAEALSAGAEQSGEFRTGV